MLEGSTARQAVPPAAGDAAPALQRPTLFAYALPMAALIRKSGWGVAILLTGFLLESAGYQANTEQADSVKTTILMLIGAVPAVAYLVGLGLLSRFRLDEREHDSIRQHLEARGPEPRG